MARGSPKASGSFRAVPELDDLLKRVVDQEPASISWEALGAVRNWRESLVLQRVRLLTEAEAVLVVLPVAVRATLPVTGRVLPQLKTLAEGSVDLNGLGLADQIKIDRLVASLTDITTLTTRITELDRKIPALLERLGCTLTTIHGIGVVNAMDLLVEVGDPRRVVPSRSATHLPSSTEAQPWLPRLACSDRVSREPCRVQPSSTDTGQDPTPMTSA
jgi:hypothetical protein